ncbi:MAG: 2,3-diphosphoglycerate-dependent phosphoglycerate mutase [Thermoplasmataceae archaeon]
MNCLYFMKALRGVRIAVLVRHGESEANVRKIISDDLNGYPLTERGMRQVEFTANQLRGLHLDGILTSPVQRAMQTANIIGSALNLVPAIEGNITESGMGPYNNTMMAGLPPGSRDELGMESWNSQVLRMRTVLDSIEDVHILVSHAMPIRAAIASYLDLDEVESFGIEIRNASMSVIDVQNEKIISIGSLLLSDRVKSMLAH